MKTTTKEAAGMICPIMSFRHPVSEYANGLRENSWKAKKCRGSECMAWRWDGLVPGRNVVLTLEQCQADGDCGNVDCGAKVAPEGWITEIFADKSAAVKCPACRRYQTNWVEYPENRRGYCGLAGKPEVA